MDEIIHFRCLSLNMVLCKLNVRSSFFLLLLVVIILIDNLLKLLLLLLAHKK
jgi:hypothetical protein